MYNSIGINRQKQLDYLSRRTKIPRIADKSSCCCEHDHFMNDDFDLHSLHQNFCNQKFKLREDMNKALCPVREFIMKNKKILGAAAGVALITLGTIKIIKEIY